jgi:hypothetical protein
LVVTLVAILVLSITVLSLLRLYQAVSLWDFLAALPGVSPLFLSLTGLVWAVIGVLVLMGIWKGKARAPRTTRAAALLFVVYNWLERWWFSSRNEAVPLTLFSLALSLACLAFIFWSLSTPEARAYFGERHE